MLSHSSYRILDLGHVLVLAIIICLEVSVPNRVVAEDTPSDSTDVEGRYTRALDDAKKKDRQSGTAKAIHEKVTSEKDVVIEIEDGKWIHRSIKKQYHSARALSEMVFQDNSIGKVYPGSLLWSEPLRRGRLVSVAGFRNRPEVTTSFVGIRPDAKSDSGGAAKTVTLRHDGGFSDFNQKHADARRSLKIATPRIEIAVETGRSMKSTLLKAGLSASYWGAQFSYDENRASKEERSFAAIVLKETYYSIVASTPDADGILPAGVVAADPKRADQVIGLIKNLGEPAYVRRVNYGRRVMITMEVAASAKDLERFIKFSYGGMGVSVDAELQKTMSEKMAAAKLKAVVIGGNPDATDELIDVVTGDITKFLKNANTYLKKSSGFNPDTGAVPVSFEVAYCFDNEPMVNYETEDFSGFIPDGKVANGETVRLNDVPIELTAQDAELLESDEEVNSDDWTGVSVYYLLEVSRDRRSVNAKVVMTVTECEANKTYQKKTMIRTQKTIKVYELEDDDRRKIKFGGVHANPLSKLVKTHLRGKVHGFVPVNGGTVGALRDVKVRVDGPNNRDKAAQGLTAKVSFSVDIDRERP